MRQKVDNLVLNNVRAYCSQLVCSDGYQIDELVGGRVRPKSNSFEPINVMSDPLLFMSFAEWDLHNRGVLAFANRFGIFGRDENGDDLREWTRQQEYISNIIAIAKQRAPELPPILEGLSDKDVSLSLTPQGDKSRGEITLQIYNLSAAMRVQMASWIVSPPERIIKCGGCDRFVSVGPGTRHQITAESCGDRRCINRIGHQKRKLKGI